MKTFRTLIACLLCFALLLSGAALPVMASDAPSLMMEQTGFTLLETGRFGLVNAETGLYQHEKTGALVLYMANEDTNRAFNISFQTPVLDDTGIPHVFEHATLGGSQKYPSKELFFNLINQTYNTFLNAMTTSVITAYPAASLSEKQLLKYLDYYTDSVLYPCVMQEESIFLEEAWRYAMADKDAPLTLAGTVYTEMEGAYSIDMAAMFNFYKSIFPGSHKGNSYGGNPLHIPELTWQSLKDYHDAYYHPSNSLTIFYGKFEDVSPFFALIDSAFSDFEKREFIFPDEAYAPITQPVTASYDFAVEKGSNTDKGAIVYLGYVLNDITREDMEAFDLLTTLINSDSSAFQQAMKTRLPSATASSSIDTAKPEPALIFQASGLNAEDAKEFESIVKESLAQIQKDGLDIKAVEAVAAATRLALLLSGEIQNAGVNIAVNTAYYWGATGDTMAFSRFVDNTENYMKFAEDGTYQRLIEQYLLSNNRTALVVTAPKPGLKEEQAEALASKLSEKRAQMTDEEISDLVEQTAAFGAQAQGDASQYVKQLQAVDVESLPVERRIYDIQDDLGEDNVRRVHASADVSGVGHALLLLDAGSIPQENLHWFKLYTDLLGKLDTKQHTQAELSSLLTRYFFQQELRPSVIRGEENYTPYLRASFIAMDEDFAPAYDLLYELLFETKLDDAKKIADVLSQTRESLKQTITNAVYQVQIYRAFGASEPAFSFFNYLNFLDYYAFLQDAQALLESAPDQAMEKLSGIQEFLRNKPGAVSGFVGNDSSAVIHREAADSFLNRLNAQTREPIVYDLPKIAHSEAIVVDTGVANNLVYAPNKDLGLEKPSGELDAVTRLVSDSFLYPMLRDKYGVYGVQHGASEDGVFILSFRDPNVKETFDVYAQLPKLLKEMSLDQEALNGFILSAFSDYALSSGELAGGMTAMIDTLEGKKQERKLEWMAQLKDLTPDKVQSYADMYEKLNEKGYISTSSGAGKAEENKDRYEVILNPFSVKETVIEGFSDLLEDNPFYEAVMFSLKQKWQSPLEDGRFGTDEAATMGEFLSAFFGMAGMPLPADQALAALAPLGILSADTALDSALTREGIAKLLFDMLSAFSGEPVKANPDFIKDLADQEDIAPESRDAVAFLMESGLLLADGDKRITPKENLTRAELAFILKGLSEME
ncbi:MAG: insulinase family protein [Bacillota bacterium]|nr:insulinase family protein [Bacillota bacterium]